MLYEIQRITSRLLQKPVYNVSLISSRETIFYSYKYISNICMLYIDIDIFDALQCIYHK